VQIWRQPSGGRLGLWRGYFVRGWRLQHSGSRELITIWGPDTNDLLRRRIAAHYAGEAQVEYSAVAADNLMKDLVADMIVDGTTPAPAAGTRAWADLTVAGDLTDGPTLYKGCSFQQLLTDSGGGTLAELAQAARIAGTEVFFDIVTDSVSATAITFQFRTYTGQPGMDVSDRVAFSQEDRNLRDPFIQWDYGSEENYIYAAGKGEQDERHVEQVYDADRYGASYWNRCEGFADARNQATDNGVREAGRAALEQGRPKVTAGGVPVDTAACRFGLDWDFGYKVTMKYRNMQFECIVRSVVLGVNDKGAETIDARLEYES